MKIKNYLLLIYLPLLILLLAGCQMLQKTNRKPQSAGSTAYCSNCLVKNVDKNLQELQKALQVNNKLPANPSSKPSIVEAPIKKKCPKGYVEGITYINEQAISPEENSIDYNYIKCYLKDILNFSRYYVHAEGKCAEGYVPGKRFHRAIYRGLLVSGSRLCILKSKLPLIYEVDVYEKCTKGYVEGRKLINDKNYNSMRCIYRESLPGDHYTVHAKGKCAEGYTEGKKYGKWATNTSYDYIDCWHKSKLDDEYEVHAKGKCAEGYVEMATNDPSTDNKRCTLHTVEK